jgi:hypothetical protein
MGRPRLNNTRFEVQIAREVYEELMRLIPEVQNPAKPGTFRHGAASKYINSLILQDLAKRRKFFDATRKLQTPSE